MNRLLTIGCGDPMCPRLHGLVPGNDSLYLPVPGTSLGHPDRIAAKLQAIGQDGERDLHIILGHDGCHAMKSFAIMENRTQKYVEALVKSGFRAVGVLLNGGVKIINPANDGDPRIDAIQHNAEELSRSAHIPPKISGLKKLFISPFFYAPPHKRDELWLSSLFFSQPGLRLALRLNGGKLPREIIFNDSFADSEAKDLVQWARTQAATV